MWKFIKIRVVETELFHADRRTDGRTDAHDEANTRFSKLREREQKQTGNDVEGSNPGIFLKKYREIYLEGLRKVTKSSSGELICGLQTWNYRTTFALSS